MQAGWQPKKGESRVLPIYQSTTFKYETSEQMARLFDLEDNGYFYTRLANPTNDAVASKIAAHAADIAKGIPHARDIDDKMGDARRVLDWDAQFACAIDPETAKAIRDARLPEDDHSDTCSMCGKFCAVRSMNKALAGEYIDIL